MKLQMCVVLAFLTGCSPTDPFVSFHSYSPETDSDAPIMPIEEDAGSTSDTGTGGASSVMDASTGGRTVLGTGGAAPGTGGIISTGGALVGSGGTSEASGGSKSAGGAVDAGFPDGCVPVTHTNGVGSLWRDCVLLGTYDENQAMHACRVSGASECRATNCGVGNLIVCGYNGTYTYGCWGYEGPLVGRAKERSDSCSEFNATWG